MPMIYTSSLATAGTSSTSGSGNAETDAIYLKPASAVPARTISLQACYVVGRATQLTTISGIVFRVMRATTASTAGTATTPNPKDDWNTHAATAVAATGGTASTTGKTYHVIFGCGAAGPGGWVAPNPDSMIVVSPAATQPSVDLLAASATVSLTYEFSVEHQE